MPTYRVGAGQFAIVTIPGQGSGGAADTAGAMFGASAQPQPPAYTHAFIRESGQMFGRVLAATAGAPVIRNTTTAGGSTAAVVITKPAGVAVGDQLICFNFMDPSSAATAMTGSSGWTQQGATNTIAAVGHGKVWKRVADASDVAAANYSFAGTTVATTALVMVAITGHDPVAPFNVGATPGGSATAATAHTAPSVVTTVADTLLLCAWNALAQTGSAAYTAAPGMVEQVDFSSASWLRTAMDSQGIPTASTTGSRTATYSTGNKTWVSFTLAIAPMVGGITYFITPAGSITSAATLVRDVGKAHNSSSTPTGALDKDSTRALAGSSTPAAVLAKLAAKPLAGSSALAGALTSTRVVGKALAGAITSAGVITRLASKALAGTSTPAGAAAKSTSKPLAGSSTPTGALTKVRLVLATLTGAVTSSATLTRSAGKAPAGSVTPTGGLSKAAAKPLAGSSTPAGLLTRVRVVLQTFTGSTTATGSLGRQAQKALSGTVTSSSVLARTFAYGKALAGAVTSAAALAKAVSKPLAGNSTPAGALTNVRLSVKALAGSIASSATVARLASKPVAGSLTSNGALTKATAKAITGRVNTLTGTLSTTRVFLRTYTGLIPPAGAITRAATKALTGASTPTGAVAKQAQKAITGRVNTLTGTLTRLRIFYRTLSGGLTPTSVLAKLAGKGLTGSVTPTATTTRLPIITSLIAGDLSVDAGSDVMHTDAANAPTGLSSGGAVPNLLVNG